MSKYDPSEFFSAERRGTMYRDGIWRWILIVNGEIKEWHETYRNAEKAAQYYMNSQHLYSKLDIYIAEIKQHNEEVLPVAKKV